VVSRDLGRRTHPARPAAAAPPRA